MRKPKLLLQWLLHDKRGLTAVTVAVTMPVLFGVAGLGIDTGLWYTMKRQNQSAADAAALSAAYEVLDGHTCPTDVPTYLVPAASEAATRNNYSGTTPTVTCPYSDSIVASGVRVTLSQTQNAWFSSWFPAFTSFTIANEAVAAVNVLDNPCMILLNPTASKELDIQGSASLTQPTCSIYADSTASDAVYAQGASNSILTADTVITAGQISTTGQPQVTLTHPAQLGAPQVADPYAGTLTHTFLTTGMPTTPTCTLSGSTYNGNCVIPGPLNLNNQGTINLSANTQISGGLDIKKTTVNLAPGTYWITDGNLILDSNSVLECTACVPGGAGVTIILTTGQTSGGTVGNVTQQSNAVVDSLNAPGSGTFAGLLLIQDSNGLPTGTTFTSGGSTFQGTPGQTLDGLVYFPDNALTFQGNPTTGSNSCLIVVANTLTLAGNSSLASSGCPTSGPGAPQTIKTVQLAE
jgi:Flp pilus assembly protein TadG